MKPKLTFNDKLKEFTVETSTVTAIDAYANMVGTSFVFYNNADAIAYEAYYTVNGVGVKPSQGKKESNYILMQPDVAGNLDGLYWKIYDSGGTAGDSTLYLVWYEGDTGTTPVTGDTLAIAVSYSTGDTKATIATATATAINTDYSSNFLATAGDTYITLTSLNYGVGVVLDGDMPAALGITELVIGAADVSADYTSVEIPVGDSGDTALTVAALTRTTLQARDEHNVEWNITGGDTDIIITNIRRRTSTSGDTTSATIDWVGDTTGFTFARTVSGLGEIVTDASLVNSQDDSFVMRPETNESIFVRELKISIGDTDCSNALLFGNMTALTNGITISVKNAAGTTISDLTDTIYNNIDLKNIGISTLDTGTNDSLISVMDIPVSYGQEIEVSGANSEYLEVNIGDTMDLDYFEMRVNGHIKKLPNIT